MQTKTSHLDTAANGYGDAKSAAVTGAVSAVSQEVSNVLADAEDLIRATTSFTGADLVRIRAQLAKGVAAARQSMGVMGSAIASGARKTAANTDAYVHAQPWTAIGASAAVAFLLGIFVARRN